MPGSENSVECRICMRAIVVCTGGRVVVLRVVDGDGVGGLTAMKMVKYTVKR